MSRPGAPGREAAGPANRGALGRTILVLALAGWCLAGSCGGGGRGPVQFNPDEPTPTRLTSTDGRVIALIPAGALTGQIELTLANRSAEDAQVSGPEGRSLVMAMELSATDVTPEPPPAEDGGEGGTGTAQVSQAGGGDGTSAGEVALAEPAEITFLLDPALPPATSIPIYRYNSTSLRYEDAGLSGTVSEAGSELAFSISEFGRYAFYSLLPEEIPPPAPAGLALLAASTQVRKLGWSAAASPLVAGYNLYRSAAGGDSFSAVNTEPLDAALTEYSDELASPGAVEYYLTAVNSAGLESEPTAVLSSPAVDFDLRMSFGRDRLAAPGQLALNAAAGLLLIADDGAHCVWAYDLEGNYLARITAFDKVNLLEPRGVAFNPGGTRIYVSDSARSHVFIYDTNYTEVGLFGTPGSGPGEFQRAGALCVVYDAALIGDVVLVADEQLSRLQSFTGLGVYLATVAVAGTDSGQLDSPAGLLYVAPSGEVLVSDSANARVQVFNGDYEFDSLIELAAADGGPLSMPLGLAVDFRGRLYVADSGNRRVVVFDSSDEALFRFGADGSLGVEFSVVTGPRGVALDPTTGYLYVSDPGDGRVVVFTS
jgi:DNA-binding beta-propeller fold protein YncE